MLAVGWGEEAWGTTEAPPLGPPPSSSSSIVVDDGGEQGGSHHALRRAPPPGRPRAWIVTLHAFPFEETVGWRCDVIDRPPPPLF